MATRTHGLYRKYDIPPNDAALGGGYLDGSQGPGVDTGVLVAYEGTLCLSFNSLKELCEVAGFSFDAEAVRLEETNAHQLRTIELLTAENVEMRKLLDTVGAAVAYGAEHPNALGLQARANAKSRPPVKK